MFTLLVLIPPSAGAESPEAPPLYRIVEGPALQVPSDSATVEARAIEIETAPLASGAEALDLPLLDGSVHRAIRKSFEVRSRGDLTWRGELEGSSDHQVFLTLKRGVVVGLIYAPDALYEIGPTADGGQRLARIDSARFPPCGGAIEPPDGYDPNSRPFMVAANETRDRIDVMAVYTTQARDAAGGVSGIEATIQAAVDVANAAFENSAMQTRFSLVHTALVNYQETGTLNSAVVAWLRQSPEVAALRDLHGADMVSLIVNDGGGTCGLGYLMTNPGPAFGSYAFQVTVRDCAVSNLSFAHEHGHNMGMQHDAANAAGQGAHAWSYGHAVDGVFRTVMSYPSACPSNCPRVPHFSNPGVSYGGHPTGITDQRDNHRTGELTGDIIANFRQSARVCEPPYTAPHTPLGDAPAPSFVPSLVWNGSDYGAVWLDQRFGRSDAFFTRYSVDGVKLLNDIEVSVPVGPGAVDVAHAWMEGLYGFAWVSGFELWFVPTDSYGNWVWQPVFLSGFQAPVESVDMVWSGSELAIVWSTSDYVFLTFVNQLGFRLAPDILVSTTGHEPSIVWTGSEYGIAWSDFRDQGPGSEEIYFSRFTAPWGAVSSPVRLTNAPGASHEPSLVWTGGGYGLVWGDNRGSSPVLYFARLDSLGVKHAPEAPITAQSQWAVSPRAYWTGQEFGVFWSSVTPTQERIMLERLHSTGTIQGVWELFSGPPLSPSCGDKKPFVAAAWSPFGYGVSWMDCVSGQPELKFTSLNCTCLDIDGDGATRCDGDCDDTDPATYPGAPAEVNDGHDNQCGSGIGGGVVDEVTGVVRFTNPANKDYLSWTPQAGATQYEVVRALAPSFAGSCSRFVTLVPALVDPQRPGAGGTFYYLVRSLNPFAGSWGQASNGAERVNVCAQ